MFGEFDLKFICKNKAQAEIILRQTRLPEYLKEMLDYLKRLPKAQIFLNRVGKKEAPGYYDIIKNPMDLSTMSKKLHLYRDLEEFKHDIDLIADNCLTYNSAEYYWDCARDFRAEAYSLLLKYQRVYPREPESFIIQGIQTLNDRKPDIKTTIAKYFKAVGFQSCEKKCIDILCDVLGYKIEEYIKCTVFNKENQIDVKKLDVI